MPQTPRNQGSPRLILLLFLLATLAILGGIYYYILASRDALDEAGESVKEQIMRDENIAQKSQLDAKDAQIERLKSENKASKNSQNALALKLKYTIKPKEKVVAHCKSMQIGRWNMPKECANELTSGIKEILAQDNRIVAFEISGLVDNLPYGGFSPELKQEGLASFRAKEAITIAAKTLPNVATFEGLSQQKAQQRGFIVRAYYVEQN